MPRSGHIQFLKAKDSLGACLYFRMEDTLITVAPFTTYLIVSLTGCDPDDISIPDLDRDCWDEG